MTDPIGLHHFEQQRFSLTNPSQPFISKKRSPSPYNPYDKDSIIIEIPDTNKTSDEFLLKDRNYFLFDQFDGYLTSLFRYSKRIFLTCMQITRIVWLTLKSLFSFSMKVIQQVPTKGSQNSEPISRVSSHEENYLFSRFNQFETAKKMGGSSNSCSMQSLEFLHEELKNRSIKTQTKLDQLIQRAQLKFDHFISKPQNYEKEEKEWGRQSVLDQIFKEIEAEKSFSEILSLYKRFTKKNGELVFNQENFRLLKTFFKDNENECKTQLLKIIKQDEACDKEYAKKQLKEFQENHRGEKQNSYDVYKAFYEKEMDLKGQPNIVLLPDLQRQEKILTHKVFDFLENILDTYSKVGGIFTCNGYTVSLILKKISDNQIEYKFFDSHGRKEMHPEKNDKAFIFITTNREKGISFLRKLIHYNEVNDKDKQFLKNVMNDHNIKGRIEHFFLPDQNVLGFCYVVSRGTNSRRKDHSILGN